MISLREIVLFTLTLTMGVLVLGSVVFGWTSPSQNPPNGNVNSLNADTLDGLDSSSFGDATLSNQNTLLTRIGTSTDAAGTGSIFAHAARLYDQVDSAYAVAITLSGIGSAPSCPGGWSEIVGQTSAGSMAPVTSISTTGISPVTSISTRNVPFTTDNGWGGMAAQCAGGTGTCGNPFAQAIATGGSATGYTVAAGGSATTYTLYYRVCGLPR